MRAVVTQGIGTMALLERPEPPAPGRGEVLVAPDAVGICGSDYHFFTGELSKEAGGWTFPRVQGHEVAGKIAALGPGCPKDLQVNQPVALFPLTACGHCYPCSVGRPNTCDNFKLIGIHVDGGLQERLAISADAVYPIHAAHPAVAAMTEPVSIAVRAVNRAAIEPGEHVVVLGAGPIGQSICLVARERGAEVLVIDLKERRLRLSREIGADSLVWESASHAVAFARRWAGRTGPPVVIDATGSPAAVRAMVDMVASAGRAVQVGMSTAEVSVRIGSLTEKELDVLGVCCCGGGEFGKAVAVVERNGPMLARLVSHEFPLEQAADALKFAMGNPDDVMKVVIRGD